MTLKNIVSVVGVLAVLTGCTPDISANNYSTNQVGQVSRTARGVVIAATPVKVSGTRGGMGGVGTLAGAVAGGAGGSAIGGGARSNIIGGVGGAVVGGVLGHYAEQGLTTQTGMEYQVRLANRSVVTITQGINPPLSIGQPVFVIYSKPARLIADRG